MIIKKHPVAFAVIVALIIALVCLSVFALTGTSTTNTQKESSVDVTLTGRITEAVKKNIIDHTATYTLESISKITPLEDSYYYASAKVADQTSSTQTMSFVIKQTSEGFVSVVLGVGNDFTKDELAAAGISASNSSKITELHAADMPAQEDIQ